jgi:hypothetical protein
VNQVIVKDYLFLFLFYTPKSRLVLLLVILFQLITLSVHFNLKHLDCIKDYLHIKNVIVLIHKEVDWG